MKQIEKKSLNPFSLLKSKIVEFRSEMCFRFRNFLHKYTKDMCFSKEEVEEIKKRVEKTKESEIKFDYFEENLAPKVVELIENLRNENEVLRREKKFCLDGIKEIYLADVDGNEEVKKELFGKFGLPFVLNN